MDAHACANAQVDNEAVRESEQRQEIVLFIPLPHDLGQAGDGRPRVHRYRSLDVRLGRELQAFRARYGLTQDEVARVVGASSAVISEWEAGRKVPDWLRRERLRELLDGRLWPELRAALLVGESFPTPWREAVRWYRRASREVRPVRRGGCQLHVPVTVNGEVFGVFGINYCRPRQFSGDEQRLLGALAQRAALAIDNAGLYARSEQRSREIEGLHRADEVLHASLKLDEVLQALVDVATDLLGTDKTAVMVWDAAHERLVARAGRGFSPQTLARMVHGPGEGVTWLVAETAQPIVVNDVRQDPQVARHLSDPEGIRSFLQVPITIGEEVFRVFGVNHCQQHTFTGDEQRVLLALAQRAALAIRNARLYERAQQAAVLEERQRLARELHDSVTQSLYGVALYTEAASRALGVGELGPAAANLQG